ncbi:hypothetical protein EXM22_15110 [Oceanispirochaeta crateris]|uniref:Uncharacterized protein n=1 Tax=Oceanispirochaeta crateris TaxID=2518645 RepID=A0A5C1QMF6_9SPIO|nr:hypothetical protein [Oceanispirochaeta crateris]QEN09243.1 hypothetical protein EXM22_15110 [Oceanispirochaeta crateris]
MNTVVQTVPDIVSAHLKEAATRFGLEKNPEVDQALEQCWTEKMEVFEQEMIDLGMDEVDDFDPLDERAALFLTYSGSLLSLSPLSQGEREVYYTSIGLRKDVPESLKVDHANIAETACLGRSLSFKEGPLKQTSPLYKIVVPPMSLTKEDQTCLIEDAVTVITEKFVNMNHDAMDDL